MLKLFTSALILLLFFTLTTAKLDFLSVFNFTSNAEASSCTSHLSCLSKGDDCTSSWSYDLTCALNEGKGCCAIGLYCNSDNKCASSAYGQPCVNSVQCISIYDQDLTCSEGTCAYVGKAGDRCNKNNVCAKGYTCDTSSERCVGQLEGESCATLPCNNGLVCIGHLNPTCLSLLPAKSACTEDDECEPGLTCNQGICSPLYSVEEGGACVSDKQCDDGNVCHALICTSPDTRLHHCSANADCASGQCVCSEMSGELFCKPDGLYDPCNDKYDAYRCQAKNKCSSMSPNENSCFYENCYSELKYMYGCECQAKDMLLGSCFHNEYCGGLPGWAIALIVLGFVAIIVVIVALFLIIRRRSAYKSF